MRFGGLLLAMSTVAAFAMGQPEIGWITGTVVDVLGMKVPEVDVALQVHGGLPFVRTSTDRDGAFTIEAPAGTYELVLRRPGFKGFVTPITVRTGSLGRVGGLALEVASAFEDPGIISDEVPIFLTPARPRKSLADLELEQEVLSLPSGRPQRDPAFLLPPANFEPTKGN